MATRTTLGATKQVLGIVQGKIALSVLVDDKGIEAKNGKKIIPAGTPVGGDSSTLTDEQAILSKVDSDKVQGILEHEVDVTDGQGNGTLIVHGYVNQNRLPDGVTISDTVKKAIPDVVFFKRN